jgi:hypothetical protein
MKALPVRRLSSILVSVSAALRDRFGLTNLAIGGGSAPALLDHLFSGTALRMRDLDLILVADRPVDQELARRIGEAADSPELRFLPRYIYPRRRTRTEREPVVAGWGVIWDAQGTEIDLSMFHDARSLELNGLMNIDRILIPLPPDKTLNQIAAELLMCDAPELAIMNGLVSDDCGGYASWGHRSPAIVAWNAIHAAPIECSMRIVRACASKLHLGQLHPELADPLRAAILWGHERGDRFLRTRGIVKMFHDDRAGAELEMMHALGAFKHWLTEIGDVIDVLGHTGLITLFAQADREGRRDADHRAAFQLAGEQGGDDVSATRLEALLLLMPEDRRERVLEEIAIAEPMFAQLVRSQLPRLEKRVRTTPLVASTVPPKRRTKRVAAPPVLIPATAPAASPVA